MDDLDLSQLGLDDFDLSQLRTRTLRPGEEDDDPSWHRDPSLEHVRQLAAQAGVSLTQLGLDVPMFEPGQEHLPELPDPRVKGFLPHDPLGFLRFVGENPEDVPVPKPITIQEVRHPLLPISRGACAC